MCRSSSFQSYWSIGYHSWQTKQSCFLGGLQHGWYRMRWLWWKQQKITHYFWGVTFTSSYLFVTSLRNCHKVDASNGSVVRKFSIKPAVRSYGLIAFDSSLQASGLRYNSKIKDIGKSKRWVKVQYQTDHSRTLKVFFVCFFYRW